RYVNELQQLHARGCVWELGILISDSDIKGIGKSITRQLFGVVLASHGFGRIRRHQPVISIARNDDATSYRHGENIVSKGNINLAVRVSFARRRVVRRLFRPRIGGESRASAG